MTAKPTRYHVHWHFEPKTRKTVCEVRTLIDPISGTKPSDKQMGQEIVFSTAHVEHGPSLHALHQWFQTHDEPIAGIEVHVKPYAREVLAELTHALFFSARNQNARGNHH